MGAFLDGYDLLVIGVALLTLKSDFNLTSATTGALTAAAFAGMAVGSFVFGSTADRLGRRNMFLIDLIIFVLAALASGFVQNVWQLVVARFILGVGIGIDMPTSTAILAEFSTSRNRGKNGLFMQTFWFIGSLVGTIIGLLFYEYSGADAWRWTLMSGAVPAIVVLLLRRGMPESPYWLAVREKSAHTPSNSPASRFGSYSELLKGMNLKPVVFLTLYWFLANLTGSSLLLYTPQLANSAFGLTGTASIAFSGTLTACYVVALLVIAMVIDKAGRKAVALVGWAGAAAMAVILAFAQNTIALMLVSFAVATILLQAAANGPFWPWSVELFPTRLRATGQGVASAAGKVGGFIGTAAFPTVLASLHWHLSMLMFAVLFVLGVLIIAFLGQETRGMSLARLDDNRNDNVAARQGGNEHDAQ